MRGIIAYGAYLPFNRMDRSEITKALGAGGGRGTRAVASYDEDTTTMGAEAARLALKSTDASPGAVLFSTADPAYLDKTNATAIQAALDLSDDVMAVDMNGSTRSWIGALAAGLNWNGAALTIGSDIRTGMPSGSDEASGGDGAVAIVVGSDDGGPLIAEYIGGSSSTREFIDRWRTPGDRFSKVWEERYGENAYLPMVEDAVKRAYHAADLTPEQVDHVVLAGLHARAKRGAPKFIGVDPSKYVDTLDNEVGNVGSAQAGLGLAAALDVAESGQVILVVHLGDGVDVGLFRTTDAIAGYTPASSVADQVAGGKVGLSYTNFLTWRGYLDREPPRRPEPDRPGAPPAGRSEDWKYGFIGSKDRSSGAIHLPPTRVSVVGGAVDEMDAIPMADVPATIATFTIDRLAYSLNPPMVAAVIDFDGGGRFQCEMTDVDPDSVAIGDRVEMTFRRLFTADGIHNYFWKARPAS